MSGVQRSFLPLPMQRMRVNRAGPSRSEILSYRAFTVTIGGNSHPTSYRRFRAHSGLTISEHSKAQRSPTSGGGSCKPTARFHHPCLTASRPFGRPISSTCGQEPDDPDSPAPSPAGQRRVVRRAARGRGPQISPAPRRILGPRPQGVHHRCFGRRPRFLHDLTGGATSRGHPRLVTLSLEQPTCRGASKSLQAIVWRRGPQAPRRSIGQRTGPAPAGLRPLPPECRPQQPYRRQPPSRPGSQLVCPRRQPCRTSRSRYA